jgi:hypothetical protein
VRRSFIPTMRSISSWCDKTHLPMTDYPETLDIWQDTAGCVGSRSFRVARGVAVTRQVGGHAMDLEKLHNAVALASMLNVYQVKRIVRSEGDRTDDARADSTSVRGTGLG